MSLMDPSTLLAPSFTATIGLDIIFPTSFNEDLIDPNTFVAPSLSFTNGVNTLLTALSPLFTLLSTFVAPSLAFITGVATIFFTVARATLTLLIPAVAPSFILTTADTALDPSPPNVFLILEMPCVARSLILTIGVYVVAISLSLCLILPTVGDTISFKWIIGDTAVFLISLIFSTISSTFLLASSCTSALVRAFCCDKLSIFSLTLLSTSVASSCAVITGSAFCFPSFEILLLVSFICCE